MRILAALVLAVLLVAPEAMAQSFPTTSSVRLTGPVTPTRVSGQAGGRVESLNHSGANTFLTGISVRERNDNPCDIRAYFRAISPSDGDTHSLRLNWCSGNSGSIRHATVPGSNANVYAVHGLRMCSNDRNRNNYKLKGLRAMVSQINGNGQIQRDPGLAAQFERTNCREWEQPQRCPTGQVAVGVDVHYGTRGGTRITGLALQCQAVQVVP
ncbi:MAG: hypothetical protein AAF845_12630 [Bacteroidota bacterium]